MMTALWDGSGVARVQTPFDNPATDKQKGFLFSLLATRDFDLDAADIAAAERSSRTCSYWIDLLLKAPFRAKATTTATSGQPDVPAGRYALMTPGGEDSDGEPVARFFQVDKPTKGNWAGYTFVSAVHAAGRSGWRKIPVKGQAGRAVLTEIAQDAQGAMRAFGKLLGQCGNCGLPLTDPASIEFGIGPVCRDNLGW